MSPASGALFGPAVPDGFHYQPDFISTAEESSLLQDIAAVEFSTFEMRGVVARRRVAFFGRTYDANRADVPPIPAFLIPLRDAIAAWAQLDPQAFAMTLINEYTPGAPIGWHRDAPQYGIVAGVSLLSSCRMKLRPYVSPTRRGSSSPRRTTHELTLERRSAYLMMGGARSAYEHHIPAVDARRYSITFRTVRS